MFEPGTMIVVTTKPDYCYVMVKLNRGSCPGKGWLIKTEEGNYAWAKGEGITAKLLFLIGWQAIAGAHAEVGYYGEKFYDL